MIVTKSPLYVSLVFLTSTFLLFFNGLAHAEETTNNRIPTLYTEGHSYALHDPIVSTIVFCGPSDLKKQASGPWLPLENREQWIGGKKWWENQVKQMMAANIDVINIVVSPKIDEQQTNLLCALSELRAAGYDVPKAIPFFAPVTTGDKQGKTKIDLATEAGKDELVNHYIRFLKQYFSTNTDPLSQNYLARIDGRIAINTGSLSHNTLNPQALTREDIETRLKAAFGEKYPVFKNGLYLITTDDSSPNSFADERITPFEVETHFIEKQYHTIITAQIKPGYWDRNMPTLSSFLARNGGKNYRTAWVTVESRPNLNRVYIESWNNYKEGSGIYASKSVDLPIQFDTQDPNKDLWSDTNDPFEYIKTTASGARKFNNTPDHAARILWHNFPKSMNAGEKKEIVVVVRNEGDVAWTNKGVFLFGQSVDRLAGTHFSAPIFSAKTHLWTKPIMIKDEENRFGLSGSIFRGCPVTIRFNIQAPTKKGAHDAVWSMLRYGASFGETLKLRFQIK